MILQNLRKRRIILWGTGKVSEEFLSEWELYAKTWQSLSEESFPSIGCVWDSDSTKKGMRFHGLEIKKPLETITADDYCIVAVESCSTIIKELERKGYQKDSCFKRWRSFLADIRSGMIDYLESILVGLAKRDVLNISTEDIKNIFRSSCDEAGIGAYIYNEIEKSSLHEEEKVVLEDILLGYIMKRWMKHGWNESEFSHLQNIFPFSSIISGTAMVLGREVHRLASFFDSNLFSGKVKTSVKTIGICDLRYSNGGAEKVLSLLLPMYVSLGYRVVLLTDERGEKEYPLPDGVVRIVLKHTHLGVLKLRLEEFRQYIKKYDIDVMCFHYIKDDISLFYETIYLKLLGIPVLAEIHIMFLMLIRKRNYAAKLWADTFRLMERIIVLSRSNELFWKNLGCKALYIPNPVENGRRLWNRPISFSKRNGKRILWIGRTTDSGKHLLDVIDIMDEVRNVIPDVELRIVGDSEGLFHLHRLIAEKHLERNIIFGGYHTDVTSFYEESDVMLMTSEMESFSMILVESKLHGVPTVMYELPYLELVRDARGVLPVPQRDTGAAARALCRVLSDDTMRHRLSIEAKRSIYPFISYDIAGAWKQVFDEISNPEEVGTPHPEQQMVQELLMQEIWKEEE